MKSVGVNDVAEYCGVSASTVCRALNGRNDINNATKEKILSACEELGYTRSRIASNLRMKRTDTVYCILHSASNEMSVEKVFFLKQAVQSREYRFRFLSYDSSEEAEELLASAIGDRPAGVILGFVPSKRLVNALKKNGIPAVCYDSFCDEFDSVTLHRSAGVRDSVLSMIKKGRKKIVLLGSFIEDVRGSGYRKAFELSGMQIDESLLIIDRFGRDLFKYGYEQGKKILAEYEFDAVQCVNDACAIGLIRALNEEGKLVPADISVAGFDDIMVSRYQTPALSTVSQPKEKLAEQTVEFLFDRMDQPQKPRHIELETTFINRETI